MHNSLHTYTSERVRDAGLEMTPEFFPMREGAAIKLFRTKKKNDPVAYYRFEVSQFLYRGLDKVPDIARYRLDKLANELGLSSDIKQQIEKDVFEPDRLNKVSLKEYEKQIGIAKADIKNTMNPEWVWSELQVFQKDLGLSDQDVKNFNQELQSLIAKKTKETRTSKNKSQNFVDALLWKRFLSLVIDVPIAGSGVMIDLINHNYRFLPYEGPLLFVFPLVLHLIFEIFSDASLGKRALKIKVKIKSNKTSNPFIGLLRKFIRYCVKFLCVYPGFILLLFVVFLNKERRAIHDFLGGTIVIDK